MLRKHLRNIYRLFSLKMCWKPSLKTKSFISCSKIFKITKLLVRNYHTVSDIVDISEYFRPLKVFIIIIGGLLLMKMLQTLFQPAKFTYQSRHQTHLVVQLEEIVANSTVRINSLDVLVNLPRTTKGNVPLLAINDHSTKLIKLYAIKNRKASTASASLHVYILTYGIPSKILTDQDPSFESKLFQELCNSLGIKKTENIGL